MLADFMEHNELVLSDAFPQLPTFAHPNGFDSTRMSCIETAALSVMPNIPKRYRVN